ncbi:MAG: NAD-dependent epimerase/dehydratase family protein [Lysobacterales bacterium]
MNFTVIGTSGFIGGALAASLRADKQTVFAPARGSADLFTAHLGHVIYAVGVTANFRVRPFDTLRANTGLVAELLERAEFESFLYLSSARIYRHAEHCGEEAAIFVRPADLEDLYDLTKLTAEALCHASGRGSVRVARLSNVVGPDFRSPNFLFDLIRSACDTGRVELRSAPESAKDYVLLQDVLDMLPRIATAGCHPCYNLGAGCNLTHAELLEPILAATGAKLAVRENAPLSVTPAIEIVRLKNEFGFRPGLVLPQIPRLVHEYLELAHAQN